MTINNKTILVITLSTVLMAGTIPIQNVFAITETQKLMGSDAAADDHFGRSVSISGDTAIVGAPQDDHLLGDSGSDYIFNFDGTNWVETAELTVSDPKFFENFGYSYNDNEIV